MISDRTITRSNPVPDLFLQHHRLRSVSNADDDDDFLPCERGGCERNDSKKVVLNQPSPFAVCVPFGVLLRGLLGGKGVD